MKSSLMLLIGMLAVLPLLAQTGTTIRGTVLEESSGEPLPGVSILEKGTTNGTVTDLDGKFALELKSDNASLRISFIGFKTQEVLIGSQTELDFQLASDLGNLDEVIVVGYGEQQKETITGAVANITSRDIDKAPSATVSGALAGKMAGLAFRQPDGRP